MSTNKQIFETLKNQYPSLVCLIDYIKQNFKVGDNISSERNLDFEVGYSRTSMRESLLILQCFGFISRAHGKPTKYIKQL